MTSNLKITEVQKRLREEKSNLQILQKIMHFKKSYHGSTNAVKSLINLAYVQKPNK